MSDAVIKVEEVSKLYRLGEIGTGTLSHDLNRWWHTVRGKEDPYAKVGEVNDRSVVSESNFAWALRDINFSVNQGEVLGIIGKNGAGKSTLLKILSKVTGPTSGKITMRGRVASLLEVGTGFHPELTGRENIYLNGAILGMTKAEVKSKLDEIVDFAGVAKYLDTPVKRYSSGMMVRLGFAVAAHLEPEILIVDEVLAVGDAEFQKKAIGKMQDVSKGEGRTILFVSHNMGSIKMLCTRAISLKDGRLYEVGDVDSVVNNYLRGNVDVERSEWLGNKGNEQPDNPYFFLDRFALVDKNNKVIERVQNIDEDDEIYAIIEGKVLKTDSRLSFGIVLKNQSSIVLLDNKHTDLLEKDKFEIKEGPLKLKVPIDLKMLNQGKYHVQFNFGIWGLFMIHKPENPVASLTFELLGLRGDPTKHRRKRETILAPYIKWEKVNVS